MSETAKEQRETRLCAATFAFLQQGSMRVQRLIHHVDEDTSLHETLRREAPGTDAGTRHSKDGDGA